MWRVAVCAIVDAEARTERDGPHAVYEKHAPRIVDAHNDLLLELNCRRAEPYPFAAYWYEGSACRNRRRKLPPSTALSRSPL